jgi:hypothetical protein
LIGEAKNEALALLGGGRGTLETSHQGNSVAQLCGLAQLVLGHGYVVEILSTVVAILQFPSGGSSISFRCVDY